MSLWDDVKAAGSGVVASAVTTAGERIRAAVPVSEDVMRPATPATSSPVPSTLPTGTSEDAMSASPVDRILSWAKTPAGMAALLALALGGYALLRRKG